VKFPSSLTTKSNTTTVSQQPQLLIEHVDGISTTGFSHIERDISQKGCYKYNDLVVEKMDLNVAIEELLADDMEVD
jgi:hypothetical protein